MPSRLVWLAFALGACSFPQLNVEGRLCTSDGRCPDGLSCVHGICVRPGTPMQVDSPDKLMDPGGADAGVDEADSGNTGSGNEDAGVSADGGTPGSDGGSTVADAGALHTQTFTLSANGDDASWCDPYLSGFAPVDEMASASPYFDLSEDEAMCRIGLRFVLPMAKGATIRSAKLTLRRIDGEDATGESMTIGLFASSNVPQFNDGHAHTPIAHGGNLEAGVQVSGYVIGANGANMQSPELSALVQAAVNRADWQSGKTLGLLLGPESVGPYWLRFDDSSGANPPKLTIEWLE